MADASPIEPFLAAPPDCATLRPGVDPANVRILRALKPLPPTHPFGQPTAGRGAGRTQSWVVIDTETTGTGPDDEVIELGAIRVVTDADSGRLLSIEVDGRIDRRREPTAAEIDPRAQAIHGISAGDVAGLTIGSDALDGMLADDPIVIAHNAEFDRRMVERHWPRAAEVRWACSLRDIDWRAMRPGKPQGLQSILADAGAFHDAHAAIDDVVALIAVLAIDDDGDGTSGRFRALQGTGENGVPRLTLKVSYDERIAAKREGARWDPDRKVWYLSGANAEDAGERLSATLGRDVVFHRGRIDARDRFSERTEGS